MEVTDVDNVVVVVAVVVVCVEVLRDVDDDVLDNVVVVELPGKTQMGPSSEPSRQSRVLSHSHRLGMHLTRSWHRNCPLGQLSCGPAVTTVVTVVVVVAVAVVVVAVAVVVVVLLVDTKIDVVVRTHPGGSSDWSAQSGLPSHHQSRGMHVRRLPHSV